MKQVRLVVVLLLIMGLVAYSSPLPAAVGTVGNTPGDDFAPDRVLVKFKTGVGYAAQEKVHQKCGGRVVGEIPALGVCVVAVPYGKVKEKVKAYAAESTVAYAEPDGVACAVAIPNDPLFGWQWALNNTGQTGGIFDADIDAPEAWDVVSGIPAVRIAILDTGIDQDHVELAAKIAANGNFTTTSATYDDLNGHGTLCAGIAAATANNALGIAGVACGCELMNVKVLGDDGIGYSSWVASGIVWAADNGAKVISMSLGGTALSLTLRDAVNYAWANGVVLVASAGNSNTRQAFYPAFYENCIAVAAANANDLKASFSNYGTWVDVAAPGVGILSTLPNHPNATGLTDYGLASGTSVATPHVAGVAALVWSTPYGTSNLTVRTRIETTADQIPGTGLYWTYGRVNAARAVW